ncbi:MAG: hypothetical protein JNL01_02230 [Bdellovibrionales bacterium]|nr:hypothetical protein [Bdellovibrionales bacterium]
MGIQAFFTRASIISGILGGFLLGAQALAAPQSGHSAIVTLVTVTTDNYPGAVYDLIAYLDKLGTIQKIQYRNSGKVLDEFTTERCKQGVVLMRESGFPVISLKVDQNFSASTGGDFTFRILRKGGLFSGFKYKEMKMGLRNETHGWTLTAMMPSGVKEFDSIYMEALRESDPYPLSRSLGTGDPKEDAVGIKNLAFTLKGTAVDVVNTGEL